jgi:hypothetical protein
MRVLLSLWGVCKPPIQNTILVIALNYTNQIEKVTTTTTSKLHKGATKAKLTS